MYIVFCFALLFSCRSTFGEGCLVRHVFRGFVVNEACENHKYDGCGAFDQALESCQSASAHEHEMCTQTIRRVHPERALKRHEEVALENLDFRVVHFKLRTYNPIISGGGASQFRGSRRFRLASYVSGFLTGTGCSIGLKEICFNFCTFGKVLKIKLT